MPAQPEVPVSRVRAAIARIQLRSAAGVAIVVGIVAVVSQLTLKLFIDTTPWSPFGRAVGMAAVACLAAIMAYSYRRSRPEKRKLGRVRAYLQVHLWGGLLFLVLVFVHTNFVLPHATLGWALWGGAIWVVATGSVGALLQMTIPKLLTPATSFEVNLERAPELVAQLRDRAATIAASASPRVKKFHDEQVAPELQAVRQELGALFRSSSAGKSGSTEVEILRRTLTPDAVNTLNALRDIQLAKREIDMHVSAQRILRGWLPLHLPVAMALVVLVVLHVTLIIFY